MMWRVLTADAVKLRRTWVIALVLLGPFGVLSLNLVRYLLLYHQLVAPPGAHWPALMRAIASLMLPTLVLGIPLLASLLSGPEHQGNAWKQLLAMPVPRAAFYLSKFIWILVLLAVSIALLLMGTVILGTGLGFGLQGLTLNQLMTTGYYPYLASYAIVAVQLLLSVMMANQTVPLVLGVIGLIAALATSFIPHWIPWTYPVLSTPLLYDQTGQFVALGVAVCGVLLAIGILLFRRKEV